MSEMNNVQEPIREQKFKVVWSMFFGASNQLQKGELTKQEADSLCAKLNAEGDNYVMFDVKPDNHD